MKSLTYGLRWMEQEELLWGLGFTLLDLSLPALEEVVGVAGDGVDVLDHREDVDDVVLPEDHLALGVEVVVPQVQLHAALAAELPEQRHLLQAVGLHGGVHGVTASGERDEDRLEGFRTQEAAAQDRLARFGTQEGAGSHWTD